MSNAATQPSPADAAAAGTDNSEFKLVVAQTIGTFLGLLAIVLAVAALLIERVRRVRADDDRRFTSNPSVLGCFHVEPVPWRASLLGRQTSALQLPTITGLIEVGDRCAWTSSVLDLMTESHAEPTWVKLYELALTSIASNIRLLEESWKDEEPILAFLKRIKDPHHRAHHIPSIWPIRQGFYDTRKLLSVLRKLPPGGTHLSDATRRPPDADMRRGLSRLTSLWIVRGKACIGVTREELAALSIIMGVTFPRLGQSLYLSGVGSFGLSLDISHADTSWSISVAQGSRLIRHAASMGNGYTTLMAKHLACGSVPFAQNDSWILSVYVTADVCETLKTGGGVVDKRAFGGDSLEFLRRLPGEKLIDAFYGTVPADGINPPGRILYAGGVKEAGSWPRAVAGIAFGGLVPQASPSIVAAVKFTVAGSNLEGCIEKLEELVDQLHESALLGPDKDEGLFGENVRRRYNAKGHAYVNYTFPSEHSNPPDAAAIFARYSNLLERMVAQAVGGPKAPTKAAIPSASIIPSSATSVTEKDVFEAAELEIQKVYEAGVAVQLGTSTNTNDRDLANKDLGAALEEVIGRLKDTNNCRSTNGQPVISVSDCAEIIRCVLAAWAFTVPLIEVKQAVGTGSSNSDDSKAPYEKNSKVPTEIVLASLPPVSALL